MIVDGGPTDQRFSVVHHPFAPKALAAPLHYHQNEDEYSIVLRGRLSTLQGDDVVIAEAGDWVFKPRHHWHTVWNPDDEPCEIIEIISPSGFENCFREVAAAWGHLEMFARFNDKYRLSMKFESVPELCERFGLNFPKLQPTD